MSASGLALVGFIITHLLGNLQLYGNGESFNAYAKGLHDLGPLLWLAEIALLGIFLLHVAIAGYLQYRNRSARVNRYAHRPTSKDGPSYLSYVSNYMIVSGTVLLVFLVVHVLHMKYGFWSSDAVNADMIPVGDGSGEQMYNLYGRVYATFKKPLWVVFYVVVMLFLGAHLRHGFWSAFQSLGALNRRLEKPAVVAGAVIAVILAAGFLGIPFYIYFFA